MKPFPISLMRRPRHRIRCVLTGTFADATTYYLQLHTGNPGVAGTGNVATTTTRESVSFTGKVSDAAVEWTGLADGEVITYLSAWDASTGGTFIGSGPLSTPFAERGLPLTLPAGGTSYA